MTLPLIVRLPLSTLIRESTPAAKQTLPFQTLLPLTLVKGASVEPFATPHPR